MADVDVREVMARACYEQYYSPAPAIWENADSYRQQHWFKIADAQIAALAEAGVTLVQLHQGEVRGCPLPGVCSCLSQRLPR